MFSFVTLFLLVYFYFCSDFNLEATVVKTDKISGLKQSFTPCFLFSLNWKKRHLQNN